MHRKVPWLLFCSITLFFISTIAAAEQQRVKYILSVASPGKNVFHVEMETPAAAGSVQLKMPSFRPGDPGLRHYARFVEHLSVAMGARSLPIRRIDPNTWGVAVAQGGTLHIKYDVEADPQDQLQLDSHWVNETGGYFDGASLFLYSDKSERVPVLLKLELPAGWKVATSLPEEEGGFAAKDYVALEDAPVVFGDIVSRSISVNGVAHRLVFSASLPAYDSAKLDSNIEKTTAYEMKLFGSAPFTAYTALFRWRPELPYGGGMEHSEGMLMNIGKQWMLDLPTNISGTFAHEYFHGWNAEAIHPRVFHEAALGTPAFTDLMWFQEGVTNYYADLVLVRTGIVTGKSFYSSLSQSITQLETDTGRGFLSLADASTIAGYGALENLDYYSGGEVVGFLLDLRIRLATHGRRSLDDVMRRLYARSQTSGYKGYTEEDIVGALNSEAGTNLNAFLHRLVHERARIDYGLALKDTGLEVVIGREPDGTTSYTVAIRQDATPEQLRRLEELIASPQSAQ